MPALAKICIAAAMLASTAVVEPASAQAPNWAATAFFAPDQGSEPGAPIALRLQPTATGMTFETDPAERLVRNSWAWWGLFDFLAAKAPPGAAPLMELDATPFPGLSFDVVSTTSGDLIPVQRGIVHNPVAGRTESLWKMIVSPGRTWALAGGDPAGWSRAAFPISLVQSQEGEAWIGLASFDYRGAEVLPLRGQFSSIFAAGAFFWDPDVDETTWGALPIIDMLARAGALVANDGRAPDGTQPIDTPLLEASTRTDYGMTFWRVPIDIGATQVSAPCMSRAGGQRVIALPNGMSIVILSRDDCNRTVPEDPLQAIILAASRVKPL
jgi:hypothetical protein